MSTLRQSAGPRQRTSGTALLTAGLFAITVFSAFEQMAIGPILPMVGDTLDGSAEYGLAFAAALASGIVGMVAAGAAIDRGRLALALTTGGVLFVAGLLCLAAAPDMGVFIAGRLVQGLGSGGLAVCSFAAVGIAYPVERHRPMLALIASGWLLPAMVGPVLAVLVAELTSWRWIFLGVAVLTPLALVLAVLPLRRAAVPMGAVGLHADLRRLGLAVVIGGGVLVVSAATTIAPELSGLLVVGGIAVVVGGLVPVLPRGFFRLRRGLASAVAARAFGAATVYSVQAYLPLVLNARYADGAWLSGFVITAAGVGWALAAIVTSRFQRLISARAAVRAGAIGIAGGAVLVALAIAFSWHPLVLAVIWAEVGIAMGMLSPGATSLVLGHGEDRGGNSAAITISESALSAAGIALGGTLTVALPGQPGFVAVGLMGIVIALVGALASLRTADRELRS